MSFDDGRYATPDTQPAKSDRHSGFTLVEVLVTVLILAILLGAVTLTLGRHDLAASEAASLNAALLAGCRQRAILESRTLGLEIATRGWALADPEGDLWLPLNGDNTGGQWPGELSVTLEIAGRPVPLADGKTSAPQILCHATGQMTPFVLSFRAAGQSSTLSGFSDGRLELAPAERR